MASKNQIWPLAMLAGYLEDEETFRSVCLQYAMQLFPENNTLAIILPLILGDSKKWGLDCLSNRRSLNRSSIEGWTRMLSGILSIVPNTMSGEMIEELGNQLRAKQAIIPAQICYIVSFLDSL